MTAEERQQKTRNAHQAWVNARNTRQSFERTLARLRQEAKNLQETITENERRLALWQEQEQQAHDYMQRVEAENTEEAQARAAAQQVAHEANALQERVTAMNAEKERIDRELATANAALAAFTAAQGRG